SSSTPIFASAPTNSTNLPGLLQKAIVQSGLFYESHQAQWIHGKNTLENLQQEPQGKLMFVTADLSTTKAAAATLTPEMPVHAQTIPLVQQQLTTLETGHLLWRGEAWPGQSMEWDIYEGSQENNAGENDLDQAAQWRTRLRLTMPELGDITATIALNATGINIQLNAARSETASLLKSNQLPLAGSLQSAGLHVQTFEVKHDDIK
ncbi:MAG: flagellar hook-length control protein FliK, partial [Betaproteobacteria bacterium]|nr:flagellar hook-length control protein FliK [Betaproteobacteria bacterium]